MRLPASEKACPFSFLSFVHRTTSHGGDGLSKSPESGAIWLLIEGCLEEDLRNGEEARGRENAALEMRDWKRLSNGRKDGLGLSRPCRDAKEGSMPLPPGDDMNEPYEALGDIRKGGSSGTNLHRWSIIWVGHNGLGRATRPLWQEL